MSILIDIRDPSWIREQALRDIISPLLPGVKIYCENATGHEEEIIMLATVKLFPGVIKQLPGLQMIQKLGAGVDGILRDPDLPESIRVCRLRPDAPADEIAEYCVAYVLQQQRNIRKHYEYEEKQQWKPIAPKRTSETTVGVLGLGHIGGRTAAMFAALGFRVIGWSRSEKSIDGAQCRHGEKALPGLLSECDFVASILPSTPETRNLFGDSMFRHMKPGAYLINAGRGDLIQEQALLDAIDEERLGGAVLDVFKTEPLPRDHPFWGNPKITVTPHVSGWHLDGGFEDIAENYRRLISGGPLLHQVDRQAGY
jgi:glyoxylate/hydroxypyruvate reductase A